MYVGGGGMCVCLFLSIFRKQSRTKESEFIPIPSLSQDPPSLTSELPTLQPQRPACVEYI